MQGDIQENLPLFTIFHHSSIKMYKKGRTKKTAIARPDGAPLRPASEIGSEEFVIDGYNLLYKLYPLKEPETLRHRRQELETRLQGFQQKSRALVTLVYDGKTIRETSFSCSPFRIVYTATGTSADRWIVDYVKSLNTKRKMVTIVSCDQEICLYGRAYGAKCLSCTEFIAMLDSEKHPAGNRSPFGTRKFGGEFLENREIEMWKRLFEKGGR